MASSLEDSELHPSPLLPGPSDLPQLRDVVLDPIITGVGTDEIAFFGDEDNSGLGALAAGLIIMYNPLTLDSVGNVGEAAIRGVVRSS